MDFENTAAFSRDYQASQECLCDSEHMMDCSKSKTGIIQSIDIDELVRKLQVHIMNIIFLLYKNLLCSRCDNNKFNHYR